MTLHELESPEALHSFQQSNANTLICFSATWCGPCRMAKPTLMDLAQSYSRDPNLQLAVGIIYEHVLGDAIHEQFHIHAFPTYVLFTHNGSREAGRIEGVNFDGVRKLVESAGCKRNLGVGHSLAPTGGGGTVVSLNPEETRARRVAMLAKAQNVMQEDTTASMMMITPPPPPPPPAVCMEVVEQQTPIQVDMEMLSPSDGNNNPTAQFVDPTTGLNSQDLIALTESMGFSLIRAQKGLLYGGGGVDEAVEWIMIHQEDDDIDIPVALVKYTCQEQKNQIPSTTMVAQSYKCNECGKILSNMANLELHANKTGHGDFEESTEAVKPLSAEEKAAKVLEIKALLKTRREERENLEKDDEVEREKQRRSMGKEISKTREQMDMDARKRDAYMRKKEKEDFKAERERIRRELEQDKLERAAHKGKLQSRLGIEGYKPDGIQYNVPSASLGSSAEHDLPGPEAPKKQTQKQSVARIDEYIAKVASYKAGGDGGNCLKTLLAYIKNIVDSPLEEKFRSINMENKVYKAKVKPFIGAKSLLLALGFNPNPNGDVLLLNEPDLDLLLGTRNKLEAALASYGF